MKHVSNYFFAVIFVSTVANAQIIRPGELIKRKSEQRVNQKIEGAVDNALDKIFGIGKQKPNGSSTSEKSLDRNTDSVAVNAVDAAQKAMQILRMGGIAPKNNYSFVSSFVVLSRTYDKRGLEEETKIKYHFSSDVNAMAVTFLAGKQSESMENMDAFIIDFDLSAVFSFVRVEGRKMVIGTGFSPTKMGTNTEDKEIQTKITLTSRTKKIGDYMCDGYLVEEEDNQMMVWISKTRIEFFEDYMKKMSENSKQFSKMLPSMSTSSYQSHPELVKLAKEGKMFLGMSKLGDKYESYDIEFRDFSRDDSLLIKASEYSSMMGN